MNRSASLLLFACTLLPIRLLAQDCGAIQPRVPVPATAEEEQGNVATQNIARQAAMLLKGDFDSIDFLANRLRTQKTRLPNGNWAITRFYAQLNPPRREAGSPRYLKQLNDWLAANPSSITAHIALANFYHQWAQDARGNGVACTVSPTQWKQYQERAAKARQVLDEAANLTPMDPEWFSAMQSIAFAEQWSPRKARDLFDRAVAAYPDYFSFYRSYANYILPKWFGHEGDAEAFAKSAADHAESVEPGLGDIIYFQVSAALLHGGNNGQANLKLLDWPRIQRGFTAHIQRYGDSNSHDSEYSYMAWQFKDQAEARKAFNLIGDQQNIAVWKSRARFQAVRNWALNDGPYSDPNKPVTGVNNGSAN